MSLARFTPMPLARLAVPFEHPDWIFELKYDGFRALAYIDGGRCELVSRNGNAFNSFGSLCEQIAAALPGPAVLDGEVVYLGAAGRPQFSSLLRRRTPQLFVAFDLLWVDGQDLRCRPLLERKRILRELVPSAGSVMCADYIRERGVDLYRAVCEEDLEGIVAKLASGVYAPEATTWVKIKNRTYSQSIGRHELFAKKRAAGL